MTGSRGIRRGRDSRCYHCHRLANQHRKEILIEQKKKKKKKKIRTLAKINGKKYNNIQ
jgi:hypothetical protein